MRKWLAWTGAILLTGCTTSSTELLPTVQPSGGPSIVLQKPYEIVFAAAVRVVNVAGGTLSEASSEKGRIVVDSFFGSKEAVFLFRLPSNRTQVEVSPGFGRAFFPDMTLDPRGFFVSLKEQIVVFEKKDAIEKERRRESEALDNTGGFVENPASR